MLTLFPKCPFREPEGKFLPCENLKDVDPIFIIMGDELLMLVGERCFVVAALKRTKSGKKFWGLPSEPDMVIDSEFFHGVAREVGDADEDSMAQEKTLAQLAREQLMVPGFTNLFRGKVVRTLSEQRDMRKSFRMPFFLDDLVDFVQTHGEYASLLRVTLEQIDVLVRGNGKDQKQVVFLSAMVIKVLEDGFAASDHPIRSVETEPGEERDEVMFLRLLMYKVENAQKPTFISNPYVKVIEEALKQPNLGEWLGKVERTLQERGLHDPALIKCAEVGFSCGMNAMISCLVVLHELCNLPFCLERLTIYARAQMGLASLGTVELTGLENLNEEAIAAAYSYEAVGSPFRGLSHCFMPAMKDSDQFKALKSLGVPFLNPADDVKVLEAYKNCLGLEWNERPSTSDMIREDRWIFIASAALAVKERRFSHQASEYDHLYRYSPKPKPFWPRRNFRSLFEFSVD